MPGHAAPAKASTERGGAFMSAPDAKASGSAVSTAVSSRQVQREYSGKIGSLRAIGSGVALRAMKTGPPPGSGRASAKEGNRPPGEFPASPAHSGPPRLYPTTPPRASRPGGFV